ncbi:MAG: SDR family oxidoreductase [Acidobacteriia bacterium]|nr:SDR family oxidoreductase [Terriglobia bacterium]
MGRLENKVALITGAAGGLGRSLAATFAREGSRLFLCDINKIQLERQVAELCSQRADVSGSACDLAVTDQARSMVDRALQAYGRIDILVNNAAVSSTKRLWDLSESDWDAVLGVNVKGLFFVLQTAAKHMISNRQGSIINIASVAGRVGRPTLIHYAASKAAVISITRSCALGLASYNVRVNAIAPGMIETGMLDELRAEWARNSDANGLAQQLSPAKTVPLGRVAQPEEIVGAAVYLASDESKYVTGQTLNVCGGIVMS